MSSNNFQWTDELVKEYNDWCIKEKGELYPYPQQNAMGIFKNLKLSKRVLFTTEDGVDIYEGNSAWTVNDCFGMCYVANVMKEQAESIDYKMLITWFSTREKAEEYIIMNKPIFSVQEIMNNINSYFSHSNAALKVLKYHAKTKINQ